MAQVGALGPNEGLIGVPGSRALLQTPALVVDLDAFEANVATMAAWAREAGLAVRPHAKTHKSPDVARRQIAAGAVGVCCATLGEAEMMVEAGIPGVHITSPVVGAGKLERLARMNARAERLSVVCDHPDNLEALEAAAKRSGRMLSVVIDVDTAMGRTGVAGTQSATALAQRLAKSVHLAYAGVQGYAGSLQHIYDADARRQAMGEKMALTGQVAAALTEGGFRPAVVTGGGTGTHRLDREYGLLTELQPGSYIFMDVDYAAVDLAGSSFRPALFVDASVVSASYDDHVTVDAGLKALAPDAKLPQVASGAPKGSTYAYRGDEHGCITLGPGERPKLGDRVTLFAPHCDPTVNLHDLYHLVRGDTLVGIWKIEGRGRV